MRTVTFRTMPNVTSCVRTPTGELIVIGVTVREGAVALDDGAFRLPAGTDPVEGKDAIEEIGAAIGNRQPRVITAAAEWDDEDGCWTILLVDEIDDPRQVKVADVIFDDACDLELRSLEINPGTQEAQLSLTIPIEGMDEAAQASAIAAQNDRLDPLDDLDDADWKVCILDHDEGPKVAWWSVLVTARTPLAIAQLDVQLARRTPWQKAVMA
jgi:hypothetical protein